MRKSSNGTMIGNRGPSAQNFYNLVIPLEAFNRQTPRQGVCGTGAAICVNCLSNGDQSKGTGFTMSTAKINSSINLLEKTNANNYKFAQGKQGKPRITYTNLCETCGAAGRLIAFRSASGTRHFCRDCAGRQGMI